MADRIRLNVGGGRFETTLTTLRRFPDSMLAAMFLGRDRIDVPLDPDGFAFVDRNAECFAAILDYYRTGELDWPTDDARRRALARELDYYALEPPTAPPVDAPKCTFDPVELRRMLSVNSALELSATNFARFDFSHLTLRGTRLKHAVLAEAVFCGADLRETKLCHADLRSANLLHANLDGADLSYADLRGARLDASLVTHNCVLDGANLSGLDLRTFDFTSCSIDRVDFSGADLRGVTIKLKKLFFQTYLSGSRRYVQREGASEQDLRGCVFAGARLDGAYIEGIRGRADPA